MTTPDTHPPTSFERITLAQVLKNLMALWRAERAKHRIRVGGEKQ